MREYSFKKIDAFATRNSAGNPAGYILLNHPDELTADEMLRIARELKGYVNEVGYVSVKAAGEYQLKYYSSEKEVDFCGHATIAIMYDVLKTTPANHNSGNIRLHTNRGVLEVDNRISTEDAVYIMSPEPGYDYPPIDEEELCKRMHISMHDIDQYLPVTVINAGLTTLLVPIRTLDCILSLDPDINALHSFCVENEVDIIEVFCQQVSDESNDIRSRVFAPRFGYPEDPATGSGNSALGYYLMKQEIWKTNHLRIEQNASASNYNLVQLIKRQNVDHSYRVWFGGKALTRIEGKYMLY